MAFNGSGLFTRLYNWVTDKNNSVKIRADRMDAEMDGFATGLSTCMTKDGQTTLTADIPYGGYKITGLGAATAATDAAQAQQIQSYAFNHATESGVADAYVLTITPAITAYAAAQRFSFFAGNTNTGASTINISGLGVKDLKRPDNTDLHAGDISSGKLYYATYNGTYFSLVNNDFLDTTTFSEALLIDETAASARSTLGLGDVAVLNAGTSASAVPQNSDLGTAAYLNVGTSANSVVQLDGSGDLPAVSGENLTGLALGVIKQTLQSEATAVQTVSVASTWTDLTDLSVSITPSLSASTVKITATVNVASDSLNRYGLRIVRDSTPIHVADAAGVRTQASVASDSIGSYVMSNMAISFMDSPSTTSATTYKIQGFIEGASPNLYVNRTSSDTNGASYFRAASNLIVEEVSQ